MSMSLDPPGPKSTPACAWRFTGAPYRSAHGPASPLAAGAVAARLRRQHLHPQRREREVGHAGAGARDRLGRARVPARDLPGGRSLAGTPPLDRAAHRRRLRVLRGLRAPGGPVFPAPGNDPPAPPRGPPPDPPRPVAPPPP